MKEVTWGKGMRLEVLSKIPTATATRKKNFSIFLLKNLVVKKKSLPLQPQSKRKRKFFERFTYQQVVQVLKINTVKTWNNNGFWARQNNLYNEEFDPGSGWTLATGLTHASRGAARCSNTLVATGARVSNAYATYLSEGNNPAKVGLIPHKTGVPHGNIC